MEMLKILSISGVYPDNVNRVKSIFTHEQALGLTQNNINVEVLELYSSLNFNSFYLEEIFEGIKVYRTKLVPKQNLFKLVYQLIQVFRFIKKQKYDFVLLSFIEPIFLPFILYLKFNKIKTGFTAHGKDVMILWQPFFTRLIKKIMLRCVNLIFPVSDYTADLVKTGINYKDYPKIIINYNGIRKDKFNIAKTLNKELVRHELQIVNKVVFLSVCDLVYRKGLDISLKANKILKDKGLDFIHIIIGNGPEKGKLLQIVNELGLAQNIRFIDYIADDLELVKYYFIADIYTMISKTVYNPPDMEGFGISYAEAGFLGKAVIGGNTGGVPSVIKHGFTGFLVDPDSIEVEKQIAAYFELLLNNTKVRLFIEQNAVEYISKSFNWQSNGYNIAQAITNIS